MNAVAFALVAALALSGTLRAPAVAHDAPLRGRIFVVDPGHGTRYPDGSPLNVGAVGPGGVRENVVTLAVGEDLGALLRAAGARVELTRSYAHPFRTASVLRLDNRARAAFANRIGATAYVALHADASTSAAQVGTSVFWLRPNSVPLANAMRRRLRALGLGESEFRARELAVTSEARVPAVLVELGFVSNPVQERTLATPAFQQRAARAVYLAIVDVFARQLPVP